MRIGDYECYALDMGDLMVDGGAFFGTVPKFQWQKQMPADENNMIRIKTRALLIVGNGKTILVDTGFGQDVDDELLAYYQISEPIMDPSLILSGYDVDISQVTDVVLTHMHFDHAGGAVKDSAAGPVPTFPNAVYHIQAEQWEEVTNPHEREKESFGTKDYSILHAYGVLNILNGSLKLTEEIEIMVSYGHTRGQQHVVIRGPEQSLFSCGDLVPTASHIPVSWHMAYDNKPMELYPEKDYYLRKAFRENWILFFPHDPNIVAATLKEGPKWMEMDQEVNF